MVMKNGLAGDGSEDFGDFGIGKDEGSNSSRIGRPDAGALAAFDGLAGGARRTTNICAEGEADIMKPGYPMKGDGTGENTGDNGVRGGMGGNEDPERSGNSRHMSA